MPMTRVHMSRTAPKKSAVIEYRSSRANRATPNDRKTRLNKIPFATPHQISLDGFISTRLRLLNKRTRCLSSFIQYTRGCLTMLLSLARKGQSNGEDLKHLERAMHGPLK
jgi:hypothetical protein